MKILITVSSYYPLKDGVQNVTQYLSEGLVRKGNIVKVITSQFNNNLPKNEVINGVQIERIKLYTKYGLYFGNKKLYIEKIINEANKYDVLINVCTQNAFTDLLLKKLDFIKCKKILYMHGMFNFNFTRLDFSSIKSSLNKIWKEVRWWYYYKSNKNNFKKYDSVIQLHEKDYANIYFKKHYNINSHIIENAVDNIFYKQDKNIQFKKPFDNYFIYVANYTDGKNQKLAIKQFLKSNISSKIGLVLIGSNKNFYYNYLVKYENKMRKKYKLNKNQKPILMLTNINRNDIPFYIKNSLCFLMTSKREVYPVSIIEAIVCGVPFISTNVGITKYLKNGIISKPKEIHKNIEKICNKKINFNKYKINCTQKDKIDKLEKIIKNI